MGKCVICGRPIPKGRKSKDTCCEAHAWGKMKAWNMYLHGHMGEIMKAALNEYHKSRDRPA